MFKMIVKYSCWTSLLIHNRYIYLDTLGWNLWILYRFIRTTLLMRSLRILKKHFMAYAACKKLILQTTTKITCRSHKAHNKSKTSKNTNNFFSMKKPQMDYIGFLMYIDSHFIIIIFLIKVELDEEKKWYWLFEDKIHFSASSSNISSVV